MRAEDIESEILTYIYTKLFQLAFQPPYTFFRAYFVMETIVLCHWLGEGGFRNVELINLKRLSCV